MTEDQKNEIVDRFTDGQSIRHIAESMGLHRNHHVAKVLKQNGINTDARPKLDYREYRGIKYSKHHSDGYWYSTIHPRRYLHREVYKHEVGEIPDGYHVHHKDHDKDNNDPSNLEAIHNKEHGYHHRPRKKEHNES